MVADVLSNQVSRNTYEFYASQKLEQAKVRQFVNTDKGCFEDFCLVYSILKQARRDVFGSGPKQVPTLAMMGKQ